MQDFGQITIFLQRFSLPDYLAFILMLLLCIFIGIYFGFVKKHTNSEDEYLVGDRKMSVLPISLSLVAR